MFVCVCHKRKKVENVYICEGESACGLLEQSGFYSDSINIKHNPGCW